MLKGVRVSGKLLTLCSMALALQSWAHCDGTYTEREIQACENPRVPIEKDRKLSRLRECLQVAYCERADAWKLPIRYATRIVQLDPTDVTMRGLAFHWLYSQWVIWRNDPQSVPEGQNALNRGLKLIDDGLKDQDNQSNPDFYFEMASNVSPVARFYDKALYERVLDYLQKAEKLTVETERKALLIRLRGNVFKQLGKLEHARNEYMRSLELNPADRQTHRALEWLSE